VEPTVPPGPPAEPEPARLMTAQEVADRLGVSSALVLRWAHEGLLRSIRLPGPGGDTLRFRPEDVAGWLTDGSADA